MTTTEPHEMAYADQWGWYKARLEARAERQRRAEAARGRRVDVTPVREHLERLPAGGMSIEDVAVAARLDRATIRRMLRPATKGVFRESAAAVLAIAVWAFADGRAA